MPFDSRPSAAADLTEYLTPRDAAGLTPVGTLREPVFAAVIEAIRTVTETAPPALSVPVPAVPCRKP